MTGGSSGIGEACALALGAAGSRVAVNYSSGESRAMDVVQRIRSGGGHAIAVGGDVSKEANVHEMLSGVEQELGPLDLLVNNAGIESKVNFEDMTLDDWRKVLDVNLTGAFLCCRAAIRSFLAKAPAEGTGERGRIILISSVHDSIPWSGNANYAMRHPKAGLTMLGKTLAQEFGARGVRVNTISPGAIRTPINRAEWKEPQKREDLERLISMGRIGEPEQVASVAVWLASTGSSYLTGTTVVVDGGMELYPAFRDNG
ncbi:MAG: SDR family oxidoreductase [Pirellulaceae bacterium]